MSRVDSIFAGVKVGMEARHKDHENDLLIDGTEIGESIEAREVYLIDREAGKTYLISVREISRESGDD